MNMTPSCTSWVPSHSKPSWLTNRHVKYNLKYYLNGVQMVFRPKLFLFSLGRGLFSAGLNLQCSVDSDGVGERERMREGKYSFDVSMFLSIGLFISQVCFSSK